jgi:hypothetical protein
MPFKCNLQRYIPAFATIFAIVPLDVNEVGLCRLNQLDP